MSKVYSVCLYAGVLEGDDIAVSVLDTKDLAAYRVFSARPLSVQRPFIYRRLIANPSAIC